MGLTKPLISSRKLDRNPSQELLNFHSISLHRERVLGQKQGQGRKLADKKLAWPSDTVTHTREGTHGILENAEFCVWYSNANKCSEERYALNELIFFIGYTDIHTTDGRTNHFACRCAQSHILHCKTRDGRTDQQRRTWVHWEVKRS